MADWAVRSALDMEKRDARTCPENCSTSVAQTSCAPPEIAAAFTGWIQLDQG